MALTREKRKANFIKWKQDQSQKGNDAQVFYADLPDDGTEDDNLITEDAYVEVYILEKAKHAAGEYLIFDPGATDSVVTQKSLLSEIRPIKHARIKGVGGDIIMTEEGTMGIYGPALLSQSGSFNLLSQNTIRKQGFRIYYDNELNEYSIEKEGNITNIFKPHSNGLYITPLSSLIGTSEYNRNVEAISNQDVSDKQVLVGSLLYRSYDNSSWNNTTTSIKNKIINPKDIKGITLALSKREEDIIDEAYRLHDIMGHPGDGPLSKLIEKGGIINCPVTCEHVKLLRKERGPCPICIRSKSTVSNLDGISISDYYPTRNKEDVLFVDIFYIKGDKNKVPYLLAVTAKSKHISVTNLKCKTAKNIVNVLIHYINKIDLSMEPR